LPALRERLEDLEMLCEHLLEKTGLQNGNSGRELSPEAMNLLRRHAWPGNVRELQNVLERAMLNNDSHVLEISDFKGLEMVPHEGESGDACLLPGATLAQAVAEAERKILESTLAICHGNVAAAARRLGIGRATLYRRMTCFQRVSQGPGASKSWDLSGLDLPDEPAGAKRRFKGGFKAGMGSQLASHMDHSDPVTSGA
jgi:DNA-binding NtrC family response regulator